MQMNVLFLKVFNMSIAASWLIFAVLVFKFAFRKAPKWMSVLLWGIVGIRLLCPFSVESAFSLVPSTQTIPERILYGPSFGIQTGIKPIDHRVNEYLGNSYFEGITVPAKHGMHVIHVLAIVWSLVAAILLFYAAASYWKISRQLRMSVLLKDNIYQSEYITSPFVFGLANPKIYIPYSLDAQNIEYVIAHERAHIQRKDYWWKPLGFLLLSFHWFNPLVWLSYELLCRDIELACDEKVIREMENGQRADYSKALLECSTGYRKMAAFPINFGETGVKGRVKNILNYKKTAFDIMAAAVIACITIAACFLTNPASAADMELMVPTTANIKGVFDSYLYVPIHEETYRYECISSDTEDVTRDRRLTQFTENSDPEEVDWEVFSLKEYPDYSVVLALAGKDYKCLYRYSPSKRSGPNALQQAKENGCVVMENGDITFGQQTWQDFVKAAEDGKDVSIQLSHYYTLEPESCSEQYYEAYKEDYPVIYNYDLSYDGNGYTLQWEEETRSFQYLVCDTGDKLSPYANYDSYIKYILTNDNSITWKEIWQRMISSQISDSVDSVDYFVVYTDMIAE